MQVIKTLFFVLVLIALYPSLILPGHGQEPGVVADDDTGKRPATAEAAGNPPGEAVGVATVNGVKVSVDAGNLSAAGGAESPGGGELIEDAIGQEVLYQAAVAAGLDQSREYRQRVARVERQATENRVTRLAYFYQKKAVAAGAITVAEITDADVAKYLADQAPAKSDGDSEERVKQLVRGLQEAQARRAGRTEWMQKLAREVPVSINGVPIAAEVITGAIAVHAARRPPREGGALWQELVKIMAAKGVDMDDPTQVDEALSTITVKVGDYDLPPGALLEGLPAKPLPIPGADSPQGQPVPTVLSDAAFASTLEPYIIATAGKAAGVESDPEWQATMRQNPELYGDETDREMMHKSMLCNMYLQQLLSRLSEAEDLTEEEVDEYMQANPTRVDRLTAKYGDKRMHRVMRASLTRQKQNKTRGQVLQELKDKAVIEQGE